MGSNPPWVCMIFSYVESNNLYHLWVFGLITDLYQAKHVSDKFFLYLSKVRHCELFPKSGLDTKIKSSLLICHLPWFCPSVHNFVPVCDVLWAIASMHICKVKAELHVICTVRPRSHLSSVRWRHAHACGPGLAPVVAFGVKADINFHFSASPASVPER